MITISVPKPLVIFGEYLENYHQPSISIPINNFVKYSFISNPKSEIKISHYFKTIFQISKKIENYLKTISPQKGLKISYPKTKVDPITFTIAGIKAISQIYKLKLNQEQIYDACLSVLSNIKFSSNHLKSELCASLFQKTCFIDGKNPLPQIIENNNIQIQLIEMKKNNQNQHFKKLNRKLKKYNNDAETILETFNKIIISAKSALLSSNNNLLADNFNKYQKLIDNLRLCDENLHKYLVSAILAGAKGIKFCTFFDKQYLAVICEVQNLSAIKKTFSSLGISQNFCQV